MTWLWSPRRTARLHRRLRGAVADIHLAPSRRNSLHTTASVDDLRRELEYQAVELDQHLVVVARHSRRQRRSLLRSLDEQVGEIEALSVRLSRLSARPEGTPVSGWDVTRQPPEVLADIAHQLDVLDAAQEELSAIERAAGLIDGTDGAIEVEEVASPDDGLSTEAAVSRPDEPPPPARP